MAPHGALILVGSGPGVGSHIAAAFARRGFRKVILMSRNADRLRHDAMIVRSAAPEATVEIVAVDLIDATEQIEESLEEARKLLGETPPECIFFNAARSGVSTLLEWPTESLQLDLQISVLSLYTVIRWGMPHLLNLARSGIYKPAFLVTSGEVHQDPLPRMFSLAACRAAQDNLLTSCAKEFGPKGVHCGVLNIDDHFGGDVHISHAPLVADQAWELYNQRRGGRDATGLLQS